MMKCPDWMIGSCAFLPSPAILAGTEANSGELANWQRMSTASNNGCVALEQVLLLDSL